MIPIPPQFALQFPLSDKYRTLNALYKEYQGLPLPLSTAAVSEGLEFVERVVASPVFNEDDKAAARELKDKLVENADDWSRMKLDTGAESALYKVLLSMQEEIHSLRVSLKSAQTRLDAYDEARFNHARRVLGLPPARSTPNTPPAYGHGLSLSRVSSSHGSVPLGGNGYVNVNMNGSAPTYSNPNVIKHLSADRLRDALEAYLDEQPPLEASRDQMIRALRVCCGMEE